MHGARTDPEMGTNLPVGSSGRARRRASRTSCSLVMETLGLVPSDTPLETATSVSMADMDFVAKVCYVLDCRVENILEYEKPDIL